MVHKDRRSENILIDKDRVKICDLGLVELTTSIATRSTLLRRCGTLEYMAPEIYLVENRIGLQLLLIYGPWEESVLMIKNHFKICDLGLVEFITCCLRRCGTLESMAEKWDFYKGMKTKFEIAETGYWKTNFVNMCFF